MRLLFDITHPVNVHFFKHMITQCRQAGHRVLITAREKDVTIDLLKSLGMPFLCISKKGLGILGMAGELLRRDLRLVAIARQFKPDVMVAAEAGVSVSPVGALLGIPQVVFDQVDMAPLQQAIGLTWARTICTSTSYLRDYGRRHLRFRGFLVQSYLDKRRFTPDPQPLRQAGIDLQKPYIVIRLVRWSATHDIGRIGMTAEELTDAVTRLGRHGRVLISSEEPLPPGLAAYSNPVHVMHLHSLLAFAQLCVAEGGTVGVEAGVLGTPAICCNTYDFGYLRSLEHDYGIIRRPKTLQQAMEMAHDMLQQPDLRPQAVQRAERLFANTDDVGQFMLDTVLRAASGSNGNGRAHQ